MRRRTGLLVGLLSMPALLVFLAAAFAGALIWDFELAAVRDAASPHSTDGAVGEPEPEVPA